MFTFGICAFPAIYGLFYCPNAHSIAEVAEYRRKTRTNCMVVKRKVKFPVISDLNPIVNCGKSEIETPVSEVFMKEYQYRKKTQSYFDSYSLKG